MSTAAGDLSEGTASTPPPIWRFANCEYDDLRRELRVHGTVVRIEAKPLDVLRELLTHAGEVVTKEELLEAAWPGLMVVDGSLATAVSKLRRALGDDQLILTVPRVGYRIAVPVRIAAAPGPAAAALHLRQGDSVPGRAQWRLLRRLDTPPASDVWLAEHAKTGERRVFKFADGQRVKALKREVTLARLLRQALGERAEFVRLLEWNFETPPYFLESEYCGPNLAEWAEARGGLDHVPLQTRLTLLIEVADAVAAAHSLDILHKDLKPANILVAGAADGDPRIKLADFGSASLLVHARLAELGITNLGFTVGSADDALAGTVMYLAPEALAGQSPTTASDVYALGVLLYQLVIGDFRRPLAPGWEGDVPDPLLRGDIADAVHGDPSRRLQSAAMLADRLRSLDARRRDAAELARRRASALASERRRATARARWPWLALATALVIVLIGRFYPRASSTHPSAAPAKAIAVLPFQNLGGDPALDYLRLALADEVANALSRTRGLAVRPFASSAAHRAGDDLQQIARDLNADALVTGRFVVAGSELHITFEAVDAGRREAVWRDSIDAPADSLIAVQVQIAMRIRDGLAPAFGGSAADTGPQPRNERGYRLYLQSTALPFDAGHNAEAVRLLEEAVALDPSYAPAYLVLGRRYYVEARYNSGDPAAMQKWQRVVDRALEIDPASVAVAAGYLRVVVERGALVDAHRRAKALVDTHPDSADAHFTLSYVFRFAGLLQDAAAHCEKALSLDARTQNSGLRSCAIAFIQLADYPRALNYVHLEPGSGFAKAMSLDMLVRQGREAEAVKVGSPQLPQWASYDLLLACMSGKPRDQIEPLAARIRPLDDPEANYLAAAHLAYCGERTRSLALLRRAVDGNYCAYPAMQSDPLFSGMRSQPEFVALVAAGRACQERFLAATR